MGMQKPSPSHWFQSALIVLVLFLGARADAALVWAKTDSPAMQDIAYGSNPVTWSSVAIGTATSDRIVVVALGWIDTGRTVTGVTIGGSAATLTAVGDSSLYAYLAVSSGTTADVVVTFSANVDITGILVGVLTGAADDPSANSSSYTTGAEGPFTLDAAVTIPTNGIGLVMGTVGGESWTLAWGGVTQDYHIDINGSDTHTVANGYHSGSGSWDPSFDESAGGFDYYGISMSAVAWAAAAAAGPPMLPLMGVGGD